ncbi:MULTISPECIES: DUF1648 domain-containing protein [unclassified Streptomyces]|uniref:DUF1648 domain-containing protein n=1 Tax=unclassified Streptomyces TaxID=2593676 RepID=UPI002E0FB76B|nr:MULTISPECIES: DUF1648 domain-containing protein [unclassified Streptomyces]WSR23370.1 DUF1648 domain-containing protein [Streptomyces sp. NBC_01205]
MNGRTGWGSGSVWGAAVWAAGVLVLLVALPLAASGRLPARLATHFDGGSGRPDGSMPLWAAVLFPALIWAGIAVGSVYLRRGAAAGLLCGGVFLAGAQVSIVRANLDHADWQDADPVNAGVAVTGAVAVLAGLAGWLASRRFPAPVGESAYEGSVMDIPAGERRVWLSRTSNPWLQLTAAGLGIVALAAVLAAVGGLIDVPWALVLPFSLASAAALTCSSVRARITAQGLEVAFGPLGLPVRRWAAEDIEWARAEHRTPAQVGGWGYRVGAKGATVMLRSGTCLVVRSGGKDFAVSLDDAARGAALLNTLTRRRPR